MATAPQIKLRDGSGYTQNLVFTTNQGVITIEGRVDVSAADIQVSINGGGFVSDPTLVKFELPNFVIPNPENYPDGLLLEPGANLILIRTVDTIGGVSGASSVDITLVKQADTLQVVTPSGLRLRRRRNAVDILAALPAQRFSTTGVPIDSNFRGFNFYASTTPGGTNGYYKINAKLVSAKSTVYEESTQLLYAESTTFENSNRKQLSLRLVDQDEFGNDLAVRIDQTYDVSLYTESLRFKSSLEDYHLVEFISFTHVRSGTASSINDDQFASVPDTLPIYYVVTSVYFDPATGQEVESALSQELLGAPLVIDTNVRELPGRNQFQIVTDYVSAIQRVNQEVSLVPGSTTRDVSIDPFSSEAERLYFLLDFVHRCQSFLTLLQLDNASGNGISDLVESSSYKSALKAALGYTTNQAVQSLIDAVFDKLASNVNKKRLPGRPAVGQAVFYTSTRPTFNLTVPSGTIVSTTADSSLGIPSVRFRVGGTYVLPASQAEAFFNFDTKRYELVVDIVAETIGSDGNRPAGQIKTSSGVSGFQVTNTEATVYGSNQESNADLAARALLGFVSVDTGTEGGYTSTSTEQIGVIKAKVVKSGDILMMRDYDNIRHKHIGGKVDIWVQGLRERQVSERFAFIFDVARDIQCVILDATNLIFRVQDSRVTVNTPITELLDNLPQGLGVRNVTQGLDYILTGAQLLDYQTFKLDPTILGQVETNVDDVITADYRFRVVNQFSFSFQPVRRVVSVVGEISGALSSTGYDLYKTADPLLEGESTISTDYLSINQVGGVPSGESLLVNHEVHVLIGYQEEPLGSIGINTKTIRVFSEDRSIEYDGPDSNLFPDYEILDGTPTTPVRIVRTPTSDILNGSTVSVDYAHDENFTVTYVINDLLQQLQRTINYRKHVTADVIVKQAVQNSLVIETTVQLLSGATKDKVDPAIRSGLSLETNKRLIGQGIAQSDVIHAIDATEGVDYQTIPLTKMAYADGSRKLRERLTSAYKELSSLGIGGNIAYILTASLQFPTTDGGGLPTEHKGVFQDDEPLTLSSTLLGVATLPHQAFIIGSAGATIPGYSDTLTLIAEGFTTTASQQTEMLRRTANHVIISIPGAGSSIDIPTNHTYAVSYIVRGDSGSKDISSSGVEFIELGNFVITIREAK
jgi:hypothetical protein